MTERPWDVRAIVPFPMAMPMAEGGGLPERMEFVTRIAPSGPTVVEGMAVSFSRAREQSMIVDQFQGGSPGTELAEIRVRVEALTAQDASEAARPAIDRVLDDLMFRLQRGLHVSQLNVEDASDDPPDKKRDTLSMVGYRPAKFSYSMLSGFEAVEVIVDLRPEYGPIDPKVQRGFDWFLKGLAIPFHHDKFIFFWIALEVLCSLRGEKLSIPRPVRCGTCGETTAGCPNCGSAFEAVTQGASMERYLGTVGGVTADDARRIRVARQMVHGSRNFGDEEMRDLPRYVELLRATAVAALKEEFGIPAGEPPIVTDGSIIGSIGVAGYTTDDADADDEEPDVEPDSA